MLLPVAKSTPNLFSASCWFKKNVCLHCTCQTDHIGPVGLNVYVLGNAQH
jgi:hypothetical protein